MIEQPDFALDVKPWAERAEHDLLAAEHGMKIADQGLTDIICFHCQQCAEKYLKALLILLQVPFPKTHDLRMLMDLIPDDVPLHLERTEVIPLNRYTIEGRYPGEWDPITIEEAGEAIRMASKVRDAVRLYFSSRNLGE